MFLAGKWAPVCSEGFSDGAAVVACKSMGFSGAEPAQRGCVDAGLCGVEAPHLSNVDCLGFESSLLACPNVEGDDVYCMRTGRECRSALHWGWRCRWSS